MKKIVSIILTLAMLVGALGVSTCFASQDVPQVEENVTLTEKKENAPFVGVQDIAQVEKDLTLKEKKEELGTSRSSKIFKIINCGIILALGAVVYGSYAYVQYCLKDYNPLNSRYKSEKNKNEKLEKDYRELSSKYNELSILNSQLKGLAERSWNLYQVTNIDYFNLLKDYNELNKSIVNYQNYYCSDNQCVAKK